MILTLCEKSEASKNTYYIYVFPCKPWSVRYVTILLELIMSKTLFFGLLLFKL